MAVRDTLTLKFEFNRQKAIEAILYIAERVTSPTFTRVCKLLYFADKKSLQRYGRFVSGDSYIALFDGPVPSLSYEMMKSSPEGSGKADNHNTDFAHEDQIIKPQRSANLDELSEAEVTSLDAAIAAYGEQPIDKLNEDSQDQAWQEVWDQRGNKSSIELPLESIVRVVDDSGKLLVHLRTRHTD